MVILINYVCNQLNTINEYLLCNKIKAFKFAFKNRIKLI